MVVSDQTPRNGEAGIVEVNVDDTVLRPIEEVFQAVVDPGLLSGFFISGASGPLEQGRTIEWVFADVGGKLDVDVRQLERPYRIAFEWSASGTPAQVEMTFQAEGLTGQRCTSLSVTGPWTPRACSRHLNRRQDGPTFCAA
jgi:uncharacterized protein YndB with AHSA1/START domain